MVNMEKLKTLILSKDELEYSEGINSWKVKLNFWDQEQVKKISAINKKLNVNKKDLEEKISDIDSEIDDMEDEIDSLRRKREGYENILDCLD